MYTEQKTALQNFINEQEFNVAMTLDFDFAFLHTITNGSIRKTLKAWDASINRKLLGTKWAKYPEQHLNYFAFIDKPETYPHIHVIAQVPEHELAFFAEQADFAWKRLRSTDARVNGIDIQICYNQPDWVSYITKDVTAESWLHSSEFKYR